MNLKEKIALREKIYEEQRGFERKLEFGCLGVFILSFFVACPISYKLASPAKKCVVTYVDKLNKNIIVQDIRKTDNYYTVMYGYNDIVPQYVRQGDTLKCVGPRRTQKYYFGTDVTTINGIKTEKYFEKLKQKTR
jgi:hypothetical protein